MSTKIAFKPTGRYIIGHLRSRELELYELMQKHQIISKRETEPKIRESAKRLYKLYRGRWSAVFNLCQDLQISTLPSDSESKYLSLLDDK